MQKEKILNKIMGIAQRHRRSELAASIYTIRNIKRNVRKLQVNSPIEENTRNQILDDLDSALANISLLSTSDGICSPVRISDIVAITN